MNCYLVDNFGSLKLLEGTEFETLTLNQQMAPQFLPIWGKVGNIDTVHPPLYPTLDLKLQIFLKNFLV